MDKPRRSRYFTYIQPVIKNQQVKSFAPYIFSLFTVTFFIIFVIYPTISTILSLNQAIEENKQVLDSLNNKAENLALGRQNLDALDKTVVTKMNALVPGNPSVPALIKSLQNSSDSSAGATVQIQPLTLISTTAPPPTNTLGEVGFNYSMQGSYQSLLLFIRNINKMSRLVTIDGLVISRQPGEPVTNLSITGRAYHLK